MKDKKDYNVEADFWKESGTIYRDNTKIIFNKDEICQGIVLMLNPGKCIAKDEEQITEEKRKFYSQFLTKDLTQKKLNNFMKKVYNDQLSGYVFIINLSNKREPKQKNLSKEDFTKSAEDVIKEIESKNEIKWIWVAFGKDYKGKDKEYIKELKEKVAKQLGEHP